ncbi:hypothetical protein PIB30_049071 [Stylosanthes scabra]|uniref:Uncharacterized protein n=1 Tax=Stylosanthes scabra TaxID=79078 RepID=A0ABU6YG11_9FABA|nr:hypothetical protein [Stylosanthes scabra]
MPRYYPRQLSSAFERAEGANAVTETSEDDNGKREEEEVKDGPTKAEDNSDIVRDTAKETMDGAWTASKNGSQKPRNSTSTSQQREEDHNNHH